MNNVLEKVKTVIPEFGSKGISIAEISTKLNISPEDAQGAIDILFKDLSIESISCDPAPKRYRRCQTVEF